MTSEVEGEYRKKRKKTTVTSLVFSKGYAFTVAQITVFPHPIPL